MNEINSLIRDLETATGPRFALDQAIAKAIGKDHVKPPPYTASLDAKLEGENIVMVCAPGVQCAPKDRWYAQSGSNTSAWVSGLVAYGHTEPLARRAAALLAWIADQQREMRAEGL